MEETTSKRKFYALTGVRAIAAFLVFFHHYPVTSWSASWQALFKEFHVGVSIFFTLSGFLIAYRYMDDKPWKRPDFRRYAQNRMARVLPMYFILTTLTFLFHPEGWGVYLLNISFLRGFFDAYKFTGIAQGWTLTVEECFYFLAPFFFWLYARYKRWDMQIVGLWLMGVLLTLLCMPLQWHGLFGNWEFTITYTFWGRAFEFFAGVYLAGIYKSGKLRRYIVLKPTITGIIAFWVFVFLMSTFQSPEYRFGQDHPIGMVLNNILIPISTAMILGGLIQEPTLVQRFLGWKPFQVLGKASYTFYLIHMGIFHDFIFKYISENLWVRFILLNILAVFLYLALERPLRLLIRYIGTDMPWKERISRLWPSQLKFD